MLGLLALQSILNKPVIGGNEMKSITVLSASILFMAWTSPALTQQRNDKIIETVAGRLELIERAGGDKWSVLLDGKTLLETADYLSVDIHSIMSGLPKAERILLRFNSGGAACPSQFRVLDLADGGVVARLSGLLGQAKRLSEEFGSCDDTPFVVHEATRILFDFRASDGIKRWSYVLADKRLEPGSTISWESYKPIKMKRINEEGEKALRSTAKELAEFDGFSTRSEPYLEKLAAVENRSGTLSGALPMGRLLALAIHSGRIEGVTVAYLRDDTDVRGFSARIKKPTADFPRPGTEVNFLFREKGQRLFAAFLSVGSGRLARVQAPEQEARFATLLWDLIGADEL